MLLNEKRSLHDWMALNKAQVPNSPTVPAVHRRDTRSQPLTEMSQHHMNVASPSLLSQREPVPLTCHMVGVPTLGISLPLRAWEGEKGRNRPRGKGWGSFAGLTVTPTPVPAPALPPAVGDGLGPVSAYRCCPGRPPAPTGRGLKTKAGLRVTNACVAFGSA